MSEDFYFVIISDAHIGWFLSSDFERLISSITKMEPKPAFVVNLGDMVHRNSKEENCLKYKSVVEELKKSDITLYHVAGNHDVGNEPDKKSLEWYKSKFGPLYYSFRYNNIGFITLETNTMNKPNQETKQFLDNQILWIKEETKKLSENTKFIIPMMHTPFYLTHWKHPCHFVLPTEISEELSSIFCESKKVKMVFSGHYHMNDLVRKNGIEFITINSCAAPLSQSPNDPREVFERGMGIVKIENLRMKYKYFTIKEIETKKEFLNF